MQRRREREDWRPIYSLLLLGDDHPPSTPRRPVSTPRVEVERGPVANNDKWSPKISSEDSLTALNWINARQQKQFGALIYKNLRAPQLKSQSADRDSSHDDVEQERRRDARRPTLFLSLAPRRLLL